jgi:hypothetical protein
MQEERGFVDQSVCIVGRPLPARSADLVLMEGD